MKKTVKRMLASLLCVVMVVGIVPTLSVNAMTQSEFNAKLSSFRADYYNHGSIYQNNNSGKMGSQCFGYANFLANYVYGSFPTSWTDGTGVRDGWTVSYGTSAIDNLNVGDIIRYKATYSGHSIFVTGIDGETIYYTDANSDGNDTRIVKWNQSETKEYLRGRLALTCDSGRLGWVAHCTANPVQTLAKVDIAEGVYTIQSVRNPDKVLDIQYDSTSIGANIQLYDYLGTNIQKFRIVKNGSSYSIKSVYSGLWLDTSLPANTDGCNIQLWDDNSNPEQKWDFFDAGNGNVYIRSNYGIFIDTAGGATDNNTNVETFHYDGTTSQQWKLIKTSESDGLNVSEGIYVIHNVRNSSKVLDIQGDSTASGANIQLYDDIGSTVQQFKVIKNGYYYYIQSVHSGCWLDIQLPCNTDGCNIQLWYTNTEREQKWTFENAGNGNVYIRSLYGMYIDTDYGATENRTNVETYHFDGTTSQQWRLHRVYNVTYDANGGTNAPGIQYKESDINLTLSSTVPKRTGYSFVRWNTKTDGTGTNYTSGTTYSGNANLTLYAQWKAVTYTISYNPNGATSGTVPTSQTKTYGENLILATNTGKLEKTGYTLDGWSTSASGEKVYDLGGTYTENADVTLYAHWEKSFILGDASGDGEMNLKDVVQITRYIAGGWGVTVDINTADVNKDGEVNLKDAVLIRRYLAGGWGVRLS